MAVASTFLVVYLRAQGQFGFVHLSLPILVFGAFANSLFEELMWRGATFRALTAGGYSVPVSIVGQAVMFGLAHGFVGTPSGWPGAVAASLFGLVLGVLAHRTRSLVLPVLVHFCVDVVILVSLFA